MDEFHANVRAARLLHRELVAKILRTPIVPQVYNAVRQIPAGQITTYGTWST
jgi:O6-methylguanine-DNA--protein-cysteine methyltransferase